MSSEAKVLFNMKPIIKSIGPKHIHYTEYNTVIFIYNNTEVEVSVEMFDKYWNIWHVIPEYIVGRTIVRGKRIHSRT
jgi:hypothetical protein